MINITLPPPPKNRYRVFKIAKRNGNVRKIYAPYGAYKAWLKEASRKLTAAAWRAEPSGEAAGPTGKACHGFMPGRNPVTAAEPHIGRMFTLSIDLEDFFDSVSSAHYTRACHKWGVRPLGGPYIRALFPTGLARQGLPSSPPLANMAAFSLDAALLEYCRTMNCIPSMDLVYTRYADDLSISFNNKEERLKIRDDVLTIIHQCGWKVNKKKTRLQWGGPDGTWTREVVGVGVNHEKVVPLRQARRKTRGLLHRLSFVPEERRADTKLNRVAKGMEEWLACKPPRDRTGSVYVMLEGI